MKNKKSLRTLIAHLSPLKIKAGFVIIVTSLLFLFYYAPILVEFPDTEGYLTLARNLYQLNKFTQYVPENYPELFRTPGYTLFLYPFVAFNLLYLVKFFNLILLISSSWFFNNELKKSAATFSIYLKYAVWFNITALFFIFILLPDSLLYSLLILAFTFLIRSNQNLKNKTYVIAILIFAIAIYIKPVAFFLALPAVTTFKSYRKKIITILIIFAAVSPWYIRNYVEFKSIIFSSLSEYNLFYCRASGIEATKNKTTLENAQVMLVQKLDSICAPKYNLNYSHDVIVKLHTMKSISFQTMKDNPIGFFYMEFKGIGKIFFAPVASFYRYYFKKNDVIFLVLLVFSIFEIILFLGFFISTVVFLLKCHSKVATMQLLVLVVILFAIGGPESDAHHRLTLWPVVLYLWYWAKNQTELLNSTIKDQTICPNCKVTFSCDPLNCWCSKLPNTMPLENSLTCFCADCLDKLIQAKKISEDSQK